MKTHAEFQIIGIVGKVIEAGSILKISIAAEYGKRDNGGNFQQNTYWNTVTIFNDNTIKWIKDNVTPGDLVHARGTLRESSYQNDGETIYGMTLAAPQFDLLRKKAA